MRKIVLLLTFILILSATTSNAIFALKTTQAQLTEYRFENNLHDSANAHHATYLQNGASGTAQYVPFGTSTALFMNPTQGLRLPDSVNSAIDTSKGFEVNFDFQVPDADTVGGTVFLFSTTAEGDVGLPGVNLVAERGELGDPDEPLEYGIRFVYSDGRSAAEVSGHEDFFSTALGFFPLDEMMHIRLTVDFETKTWATLINGKLIGSPFEAPYDIDLIKAGVSSNPWYFGWAADQEFEMTSPPVQYTADMILDNLQIASPLNNGDLTTLQSALSGMTNHADGSIPLDDNTLNSLLADIYVHLRGNYDNAETEILQFIQTYEANYPPVFADRESVAINTLAAESQALIYIQQTMFDEQFVDGNMENMAGISYEFASIFPGAVSNSAPVQNNATVTIDGTYNKMHGAPIISDFHDAKRPTGYYAAPGALITIDIPNSLTTAGMRVMVGAHEDDFSGLENINRFPRIVKNIPLDSTQTTVVNPFGGGIYIRVPEGRNLGLVDIAVSGAIKSAYFSTQAALPSNMAEWQTDLNNAYAPWVDLKSDKNMMTLPLTHLVDSGHSNPTNLLATWDKIMDGYRFVGGRPSERGQAEYFLIDSRLPSDAFGTGYPQVIGESQAPFGPFESIDYYPTQVFNPDFHISEFNTTLHEWGHAAFHPTPPGESESIIHVNATYIYDQQFDLGLDEGFKYSSQEFLSMDDTSMDWMLTHNFRNNLDMGCNPTVPEESCEQIAYQHRGHAKYAEVARLFSWQAVHNMNKVFYDEWRTDPTFAGDHTVSRDDMLRAASEANDVNMAPLFHFWGHAPSAELTADLTSLPASPEIRDRLRHYWKVVPATQTAFQPVYERLINGDPNFDGDGKGEGFHAQLTEARNNYDTQQYAKQMRDQICSLIDLYYPANPAPECSQASNPSVYLPIVVKQSEPTRVLSGCGATRLNQVSFFLQ